MAIHNNTEFNLTDIELTRVLIGVQRNKWRRRDIKLYYLDETNLISVGRSFDDQNTVTVCVEPRNGYATALDYWAHGQKTYTSE